MGVEPAIGTPGVQIQSIAFIAIPRSHDKIPLSGSREWRQHSNNKTAVAMAAAEAEEVENDGEGRQKSIVIKLLTRRKEKVVSSALQQCMPSTSRLPRFRD